MTPETSIKDAIENAKAQTALEAAINSLSSQVQRLTVTVEKNNEKLERLSALETNHANTSTGLERAFRAIEDIQGRVDDAVSANQIEHKGYDRWVYMAVGFATAISVVWSVLGYRMNAMIDKTMESVARMEMHIAQDRVMSAQDVRQARDLEKP